MKQQSETIIFGDRTPRESVGEGIVRRLFGYNDSILMAKVEFDAGAVGSVHAHPHTQLTELEVPDYGLLIEASRSEEEIVSEVISQLRTDESNAPTETNSASAVLAKTIG